jgi:hypothetical protein
MTQQLQAEALLALQGLLATKPDAPFPALDCCGGKALPGVPCKVLKNGMSLIPVLKGGNSGIQGSFSVGCQFFAPRWYWQLTNGV